MKSIKLVALLLIAAGLIGLLYGAISYSRTTHDAKIGPFELSVEKKESVNVPVWAGVGAVIVGGALLLGTSKS